MIKFDGQQRVMDLHELANSNIRSFKLELSQFVEFLRTNPMKLRSQENALALVGEADQLLKSLGQRNS
jgi:hypothetical protein